jgi:aryl-alcohol dehydrogenase-like predicted oxidoreductase
MHILETAILGRTGYTVTRLSAGGHFTNGPTGHKDIARRVRELNHLLDAGVKYFDVQWEPEEDATAQVMKHRKDEMTIAWPIHGMTQRKGELTAEYIVDYCHDHQKRYGISRVEIILWVGMELHANTQQQVMSEVRKAFAQLKKEGFCEHLAFSCHHSPQMAMSAIEAFDDFSVIMVPYGPFLPMAGKLLETANKKNIGMVTMKPFGGGGGLLNEIYAGTTGVKGLEKWAGSGQPYMAAIRWVLRNKHLHCAVPGLHSVQEIDEILEAARTPFGPEDARLLDEIAGAMKGRNALGEMAGLLGQFV